jgi:hypothetical protein
MDMPDETLILTADRGWTLTVNGESARVELHPNRRMGHSFDNRRSFRTGGHKV